MIKFLDLKSVNERFELEFKKVTSEFLHSGSYILGEQVSAFEKEYAMYCGTDYCIGVSSGLDALKLIFEAYKFIGTLAIGDEVIVPANTFIASVLAISNSGLKPVLVDPCLKSYNIDLSKIESSITPKTKAILGVHLYGQLFDVMGLEYIAKKYNLLLIEDAAQAHGAVFSDGRKAGNVSDAAAFSFYPTKNLGALGDAGAITSNNAELAEVILKLRTYGSSGNDENVFKGYNCRLDELQASFLRIKLKHLNSDNEKRRNIAKSYLKGVNSEFVILPKCEHLNQHVFHLFVIRCERRDELKDYLSKNGVETLIHYPIPIHKQRSYEEMRNLNLPVTQRIHNEVLSLPLHSALLKEETLKVISILNCF